jgi:cysteinyl-tRNA synthetase
LNKIKLMKLYNTLTREIEEIAPLRTGEVSIYTCGPTVYDYAHVGHWFTYVRMDTLVRALKSDEFQTNWVMNITDVGHLVSDADEGEDKLEKGAKREGKTAWEVAEFYTEDFLRGMDQLNMLKPTNIVKATEHIKEQIELIQRLEAKGFTYVIDDGVYYDTSKFEGYAAFAALDLDEQMAGARVVINNQKKQPWDFALWKFSPKDHQRDMEWESPWGKGFPGWHIECSAMSMKYLGDTLDIHTGGIDHVPVHHTNEIAQSEAATGKRFANYWMHSNHVLIEGEKISKSLGNGIRLQELEKRGISPLALRLHVLESHYRSQSKFSWDSLQAAQNRLKDYRALADLRWQTVEKSADSVESFKKVEMDIKNHLLDDLNTPQVLTSLSAFSDVAKYRLIATANRHDFNGLLKKLDELLGLDLLNSADISDEQKELIVQREESRQKQDWLRSDELRDALTASGLGVRDTEHGTIWFRL